MYLDLDLNGSAEPMAGQVARALQLAIVKLQIPPGERLSEQEVASRLGVSRQPVREAFIKLKEAGLLTILPQRSTVVVKISVAALENARFIRESIECAIARDAALVGFPDWGIVSRNLSHQREIANSRNPEAFFPLDEEFHRVLALAAGRPDAWKFAANLKPLMDRVGYLVMADTPIMDNLVQQHEQIAAAVHARDPDAAIDAMRRHLTEILRPLPDLVAHRPDLFETRPISGQAGSRTSASKTSLRSSV
jgi:GntR family transcriptional regulator, rspAB operon transcriptional repressor